jgi:hypothetical protein
MIATKRSFVSVRCGSGWHIVGRELNWPVKFERNGSSGADRPALPGQRTKPLYRDFPASQVASSNFIFSFLYLDAPIKMQHHREQTAHLQTALLHRLRCGPRYEPLSRTPFARRLYPEGLNMRFTEFTCCRSDLCNASS